MTRYNLSYEITIKKFCNLYDLCDLCGFARDN
jgi:hypothetical protein